MCRSGRKTKILANLLAENGFEDVSHFCDGMLGYDGIKE